MTSKLIAPPMVQPVTLAEAKQHLRVSSSEEDDTISDLVAAATNLLERETGLALSTQGWRQWIDCLPVDNIVQLTRHPVQRITSVTWYEADGLPTVLPGNSYFLNTMTRPARLRFDPSACPNGYCNGIEIDFEAGFGDVGAEAPDPLRRAILALVAHWYEFRGVYSAQEQPVSVPEVYQRIVNHYRQVRL